MTGEANFQPATQSTRRKRQQIRAHPRDRNASVNVRPPFVANAQPPELIQPSEGPFYYPSASAQSAAMFGIALF